MGNAVEADYSGWPDRLYIMDQEGRIAYKGRPDPGGFRVGEMAQAPAALLAR